MAQAVRPGAAEWTWRHSAPSISHDRQTQTAPPAPVATRIILPEEALKDFLVSKPNLLDVATLEHGRSGSLAFGIRRGNL